MNFPFSRAAALWGGSLLLTISASAQQMTYPQTRKVDQADEYFGTKVYDPYRWLEDDNSPETAEWVKGQNAVTFGYLNQIPFRPALKQRLEQLVNFVKYGGAFQQAGRVFFYKNDGLQNQSVLYVQQGLEGKPEVLIDPNKLSADGTVQLKDFSVSDNGRYAAFGISRSGSDWMEYQVMDLTTKQVLPEKIEWVKFGGASWRQSEGFYYSRYPKPEAGKELTARNENQEVYFHRPGTDVSKDEKIYAADPAHPDYYVGVSATEDGSYELLWQGKPGQLGNALFCRQVGSKRPFQPVVPEIGRFSYGVIDNDHDALLIQTNDGAPNSRIVRYVPGITGGIGKAETMIAERPEAIDAVATAGGRLIVTYMKDVTSRVSVFDYKGKSLGDVKLPAPGTAVGFGGHAKDTFVFYQFTSYNYPTTLFRYDLKSGQSTVFKAPQIPNFQPTDYEVRQDFVTSKDGTRVPIFVVHKKGLKLDGQNPTILYGYGGFNVNLPPGFSALRLGWLEQGGVYAVANLRGGSEYGEKWHEAGMRLQKQNVFDDCIAAAEWLIKQKYTSPAKLAVQGGSNGGLLVGAVINQRPDLFGAALPAVGVMDMLRYQKFTAGQFWEAEYGTSTGTADDFKNLYAFSPLHNIKPGAKYPAVMVTTADHDDRVVPAHSFKYAATLQEKAAHDRPLLIRIETKSGHGSSSLTKQIDETADAYSFLFKELGVTPKL